LFASRTDAIASAIVSCTAASECVSEERAVAFGGGVVAGAEELQFAALECYRAVAEKIPEGVTLSSMSFQKGKSAFPFMSWNTR
jgi:hypothetical protein